MKLAVLLFLYRARASPRMKFSWFLLLCPVLGRGQPQS
nr:MAG TPA: hypothetical protein [Inoviridae sp.]